MPRTPKDSTTTTKTAPADKASPKRRATTKATAAQSKTATAKSKATTATKATKAAQSAKPSADRDTVNTSPEPQIIPFNPVSHKLFDLKLLPDELILRTYGMAPSVLHDYQNQLNQLLQEDENVTTFFSTLMYKHYAALKEKGLDYSNCDLNLLCFDISTMALTFILGVLQGHSTLYEQMTELNSNPFYRVTMHSVLPQSMPFEQHYHPQQLVSCWLNVLLEKEFCNPRDLTTQEGALRVFPKLLSNLAFFQAWRQGHNREFCNPNASSMGPKNRLHFKSPRFDIIHINPLYMSVATQIPPITEGQVFSGAIPFLDCSNMKDFYYGLSAPVSSEYEGMKRVITALKSCGYDLSHVLFFLMSTTAAEQTTKAITEAGAHYFILSDDMGYQKGKPRVEKLREKNFFGCNFVFRHVTELAPYTNLPVHKLSFIDSAADLFITSLDFTADDNATKLLCALDGMWLFAQTSSAKDRVSNASDVEELVSASLVAGGLYQVRDAFHDFVFAKLQEPEECNLVKAVLLERSIIKRFVAARKNVPLVLSQGDLFLHFLGQFFTPLLKDIEEPIEVEVTGF